MEGVTLEDPSKGNNPSLQHSILAQGLYSILGTGGSKSAMRGKQWRDKPLVHPYKQYHQSSH